MDTSLDNNFFSIQTNFWFEFIFDQEDVKDCSERLDGRDVWLLEGGIYHLTLFCILIPLLSYSHLKENLSSHDLTLVVFSFHYFPNLI